MPLFGGKNSIGKNIATEESTGKPKRQALAIALSVARKSGAKTAPKPANPFKARYGK